MFLQMQVRAGPMFVLLINWHIVSHFPLAKQDEHPRFLAKLPLKKNLSIKIY